MNKHVLRWILISLLAGVFINAGTALVFTVVGHLWPGAVAPITIAQMPALRAEFGLKGPNNRLLGGRADRTGYSELRIFVHEYYPGTDEESRFDMFVADMDIIEVEAGWPLKSFRYRANDRQVQRASADLGRPILPARGRMDPWLARRDIIFPTSPIWRGAAWNSLLYAAIVFIALLLLRINPLRRRLRLQRGLCPRCAYPIGVNERCTECGEPLPAHARQARA